jgi:hypothetical protein
MKLGNLVKNITEITGIKYLVGDCKKCEERRIYLNELFSKQKTVNLLSEEQLIYLESIKGQKKFYKPEVDEVLSIYKFAFGVTPKICNDCGGSGFKEVLNQLFKLKKEQQL